MIFLFVVLLLALFILVPLYPCVTQPENVLDWLLSVLVESYLCVFVFVPLGVSYGSPMFDLSSWSFPCSPWCLVPQILQRPRSWLLDSTAFSVFDRPELPVLSSCGVLVVRSWGRALGGFPGSLVIRITFGVHDNAKNRFFVLMVFTRKQGTKCL